MTSRKPPHDFYERLAFSQAASDEPFWNEVYQKAFPDMVSHTCNPDNNPGQHAGIDRFITLSSGAVLRIDEKKREEVYNDILLEYISNDRTHAPGWMEKSLQIDYLAYAFMPIERVYLYPWLMLRRAWLYYKNEWLTAYPTKKAPNRGYKTWSVAVPISVLQKVMRSSLIIQLGTDAGNEPEPDDLVEFATQALGAIVEPDNHNNGHYTQLDLF